MFNIGDVIKSQREEQRINQEDLSFGICSVSNLSRIENGAQTPNRATYEALMQRLGLQPSVYPSFVSPREIVAHNLKYQINDCIINGDYATAAQLCTKLESEPKLDRLYSQFILYVRTLIYRHEGGDPAVILSQMKDVLNVSIKEFEPKKILRHVLTKDELCMINHYAISQYNIGDTAAAIETLESVKEYIEEKVIDTALTASVYAMTLYSLSKYYREKGEELRAIELCDVGIQVSIQYGKLDDFADLIYNKGYSLAKLGHIEEAKKCIQESFYIDRARGKMDGCDIAQRLASHYGFDI